MAWFGSFPTAVIFCAPQGTVPSPRNGRLFVSHGSAVLVEDGASRCGDRWRDELQREVHLVSLPLPNEALLELGEHEVELSVTLSFFIEPNESNRRYYAGSMLRWDIQRPTETDEDFRRRVNRLERPEGFVPSADSYPWDIGPDTRSRGSVQSDRCRVTAASLAGRKLIAVFPVLGWWEGRADRLDAVVPYSLVARVDAGDADIDLYAEIAAEIGVSVEID